MNIEEAIDILKNSVADYVIGEYCEKCADNKICDERNEDCYYQQAIDAVITAYEKEKEKNKELIKERATEIVYVDKNFVRKDKIKAKIEDILNSENSEAIEKLAKEE